MNIDYQGLRSKGKILLQLSGGKDSLACLSLLHDYNIHFEAIHFKHSYAYQLPTEMAMRACEYLGVKLKVVDITDSLNDRLLGNCIGRPCRICKAVMDNATLEYAINIKAGIICVGDNADDTMLINRLINVEGRASSISHYFNSEVVLPEGIEIYRPLLTHNSNEIMNYVQNRMPFFQRVNDTGDKYFEYSREGCPLQFKNIGIDYSLELMEKLLQYNTLCAKFATMKGIRCSIHLPDEYIVSIPNGYEEECREYLIEHGCVLKAKKQLNQIVSHVITLRSCMAISSLKCAQLLLNRLLERLGFVNNIVYENAIGYYAFGNGYKVFLIYIDSLDYYQVTLLSDVSFDNKLLGNLSVELFHAESYEVSVSCV